MESFAATWLALREPADRASRSQELARVAAAHLAPAVTALDLGAGTGSNARYLAPRLPQVRTWRLVDHDDTLLADARQRLEDVAAAGGPAIRTEQRDLASLDPELFAGCGLVTGSALLDLVSEPWLRALARRCREANAVALFALTYDGRIACEPADPFDARIQTLVNAHQGGDKGFGHALGPEAAAAAKTCFADEGFAVQIAPSDWVLRPESTALQRELVGGWARAATELDPVNATAIADWMTRRLAGIEAGESSIVVGHQDLVAWMAASGSTSSRT